MMTTRISRQRREQIRDKILRGEIRVVTRDDIIALLDYIDELEGKQ